MRIQSTILALAAATLAVPAIAADDAGSAVSVRYNDLNLASKAGQEELDRRLERAARSVCGLDAIRTGTRLRSAEARRCYREARATLDKQFASLVSNDARGG
jgi:UrcA family protein